MIAALMLYAALVTSLLLGAAFAGEYLLRALARPTRAVWALALAGALVLPAVTLVQPPARRPLERTTSLPATASTAGAASTNRSPVLVDRALAATSHARIHPRIPAVDATPFDRWNGALGAGWLAGSLLLAAYLAIALAGLRRVERSLRRDTIDGQSVLLSRDIGPALLGVVAMRIVLPDWVLALEASDRRIVLAHEREHALARDPALLFAGFIVLVLQPWNVALWVIVARLRYAIETDCDARVLGRWADARAYADLLLRVHAQSSPLLGARLAFVGMTSRLEGRIMRIIRERPRLLSSAGTTAAVAFAASLLGAWVTPAPIRRPPSAYRVFSSATGSGGSAHHMSDEPSAPQPAGRGAVSMSGIAANPPTQRGIVPPRGIDARPQQGVLTPSHEQATACGATIDDPAPLTEQLEAWARERHADALHSPYRDRVNVIAFVVEPGTCRITRDTVFTIPRSGRYDALPIFTLAFPDLPHPDAYGLRTRISDRGTVADAVLSFGMFDPPHSAKSNCVEMPGGSCSLDGPVVIRVLDSLRVLVAAVGSSGTSSRGAQLFAFTSAQGVSPLLARSITYAHVEYTAGELYVTSRDGSDPSLLFRLRGQPGTLRHPSGATTFDQGLGISVYAWDGVGADDLRRLAPTRCSDDPTGACYAVDGKLLRFPL